MFEILSKILSFYALDTEQITQTAWFRESSELQMLALKLCYFGKGYLITVENFQSPEYLRQLNESLNDSLMESGKDFLDILVENIVYGEYLLTRSWFCMHASSYQIRVLMLKLLYADRMIFSRAGDMRAHLDALLNNQVYGTPIPEELMYYGANDDLDEDDDLDADMDFDDFDAEQSATFYERMHVDTMFEASEDPEYEREKYIKSLYQFERWY
jgi:hypothetical protein